jgi:antitoxin component of MazEF toxin-antitoxin module
LCISFQAAGGRRGQGAVGGRAGTNASFILRSRREGRLDSLNGKTQFYGVVKTFSKIGNSQGLMFDAALMDLARLKPGDRVNVEVYEGGTLTLTPLRPRPQTGNESLSVGSLTTDEHGVKPRGGHAAIRG